MNTQGSAILIAFVIILLFSAILLATAQLLNQGIKLTNKVTEDWLTEKELLNASQEIIPVFYNDSTPYADSKTDDIWQFVKEYNENEIEITIKDLSSDLNPNWIRKEILEDTELSLFLMPGVSPDELQQYRNDKGFSNNIKDFYKDYFKEEALTKYLSPYSYANINITDEFALRNLYELITDNENGAEIFRTKIQKARINKKILKPSDMKDFLSTENDELYPIICALPAINVNFVDPLLLREILRYSFGEDPLPHPDHSWHNLISMRENMEILPQNLSNILGINNPDHLVFQYLGTKTWFWSVKLSKGNKTLEIKIAVRPENESIFNDSNDIDSFYSPVDNSVIQIIESCFWDD